MSQPPAHYRSFWKLQDNKPILENLASCVLMYYIQNNAKNEKERLNTLKEAAEWVGFSLQIVSAGAEYGFNVADKQSPLFEDFREEIRTIRRGNFESEIVQIASIMEDYKSKIPRWPWNKWPKSRQPKEKKGWKFV